MILRAREAVVAQFLRKALAVEPLSVPKLDAMARAAGLLDEGQRITNAKVFRRAKDLLGIQSVRNGFGAGGGWSWELPPGSDAPATISATTQERSAPEPATPREWIEGVARLERQQLRPPGDIPFHRWQGQFMPPRRMAAISASDISSGCFLVCSLRSIHSPASLACAVVAVTMAAGWLSSLAISYASANCARSCSIVTLCDLKRTVRL